MYFEFEMKLNK